MTFFEIQGAARILFAISLNLAMTGCFWYEDPWFGDALIDSTGKEPCFGIQRSDISDPDKTKISSITVSHGKQDIGRYRERDYERMSLAVDFCMPYGTLASETAGTPYELRPGEVYEVLVRTTQSQYKFNRTFYTTKFCIRNDDEKGVVAIALKSLNDRVCPDGM